MQLYRFPGSPFDEDEDEFYGRQSMFGRFGFGQGPFGDMDDMFRGVESMMRQMDSVFGDVSLLGLPGRSTVEIEELPPGEDGMQK